MAVLFKRFSMAAEEYETVGVVIEHEYYGDDSNPVQGLNLKFEGVEDELINMYNGWHFRAMYVPDDEIDIDEFR